MRKPTKVGASGSGAKPVQRTTAQVNRESKRYKELVKTIKGLESKKKEMAAELDIQQEEEEAAEETAAVSHVSQVRQNMVVKGVVQKSTKLGPHAKEDPKYDSAKESSKGSDMPGLAGDSGMEGGDAMDIDDNDESSGGGNGGQPTKVWVSVSCQEQLTETTFVVNKKAKARRHEGQD